jgi:hypothetical protein
MRKLHVGADLRDMESGIFELSRSGMRDFVVQTQRALSPSASLDSLRALPAMETDDPLDAAESKAHLFSAFHILRKRGFGVFGLSPATAEALSTVAGLPAVICLVLRATSGKGDQVQSEQELWGNDLHALPVPPADVLLHVVSSVSRGEGGYMLTTLNGPSWSALPDERVEGEILPASSEESRAKYFQVVGHFVITPLSEFELEGHIEERYSLLPYRFRKPEIVRIR